MVLVVLLLNILWVAAQTPIWSSCPFNSTDPQVQCASVSVPLDWFNPQLGNISLFVSKIPRTAQSLGTVWFLNGGSGVGGQCFAQKVEKWVSYYNSLGFDLVAPDFRGTGSSVPKIDCPDNIYNVPSFECAAWLKNEFGPEGMYYYSLTQGSYDLNYLISTLGGSGPHYIQGDSFGTFWGQKYATIFPEQADAFIFESFIAMNRWTYFESTLVVDWVGRQVLRYCGLDPICGGRVAGGSDPEKAVEDMMNQIADGTFPCLSKLPSVMAPADGDWKTVFQFLLANFIQPDRNILTLIPALVYRIQRCSQSDVQVIYHLWNITRQLGNQDPHRIRADPCDISNVILYNAFFQEGIQHIPPISIEGMIARAKTQLFSVNMTSFGHLRETYNTYFLTDIHPINIITKSQSPQNLYY